MKTAVIITNLGTPSQPTKRSIRQFLSQFLADQRVVEIPKIVWYPLLYGIILPLRAGRLTKDYQALWQQGDSPLRLVTQQQTAKLQQTLTEHYPTNTPAVAHAMTYGDPNLADVIAKMEQQDVKHFLILPLYPQYSATTTGAVYDQLARLTLQQRNIPQIHVIKDYHDNPHYIAALAESVKQHWREHQPGDRLLMSFHGIPQRCVDLGDPYYQQCQTTAQLLANELALDNDQWSISFQSRFGKAQWLSPYTDDILAKWGAEAVKKVDVICPAFAADCLETLEEIDQASRQVFIQAGGESFHVIPCLNDQPKHITMMAALVQQYLPQRK